MKLTHLISTSILAIILLGFPAFAETYVIPTLPDLPGPDWNAGRSVTYSAGFTSNSLDTTFDLRIAVLGTETDSATNQTLYWLETDFFNFGKIPAELNEHFMTEFGEPAEEIKLNMLIPKYDLTTLFHDPSQAYKDFTEPGFVRKLYFQFNNQAPYDVDTTMIVGLIIPYTVQSMLGTATPPDFVSERNIGIELVQSADDFTTEVSDGETTTDAGTFNGRNFSFTSNGSDGASGYAFLSNAIGILPLVMYTCDWLESGDPNHMELELVEKLDSGAASMIHGDPVVLDLNSFLYGTS
jgi:hypothetical protein